MPFARSSRARGTKRRFVDRDTNRVSASGSPSPASRSLSSGRIVDILNGKRSISAETALRLGRHFGNEALFWINLQAQYDLAVAEREVGQRVKREVKRAA